ncbi:Protein Fam71B [Manis pentadactyla]|nr:Protein Fam71B [Manis pentadactyla]
MTTPEEAAPDTKPTWHDRESAARAKREEVTAEEPVARAKTPGAEGVAAGTTAGTFSMTVTESASEQFSTALAGAATECPGGRKINTAIFGAANMCPESIKVSLEGATNKVRECNSSVSAILSPEDSVRMATAGAAPASKIGGEAMKRSGMLASPTSTRPSPLRREQTGRQPCFSLASTEAHKGRSQDRYWKAISYNPQTQTHTHFSYPGEHEYNAQADLLVTIATANIPSLPSDDQILAKWIHQQSGHLGFAAMYRLDKRFLICHILLRGRKVENTGLDGR